MTNEEAILVAVVLVLILKPGIDWGGGWVWPVPDIVGPPARPAEISQEYKPSSHLGVDIMFRGRAGEPRWVVPVGTPVVAARDAVVWSTGVTARGHNVVLDHGAPWATFYQHLDSVSVAKGQKVTAGQQIGTVGADPTDPQGLRHLHFATWYKGNGDSASVDPGRAMLSWRRVAWS
jgi:murein DD-endopeptidase MepM/ murein hydrolase activator NlpD